MSRLRILVLGPDCDPERVSIPFVTYSHAAALAELHDVTLAARAPWKSLCAAQRRRFAPSKSSGCLAGAHLCVEFAEDLQV